MTNKHTIFICLSILFLVALFGYSIFRDYGYSHLSKVRLKQAEIIQTNAKIAHENRLSRIEIDRLERDTNYIESIARHELGMVRENELILKPGRKPNPKQ